MDIPNAITILQDEFETNAELEFDLYYELICDIYICSHEGEIHLVLQVKNYNCKIDACTELINETFTTIDQALSYLNSIFDENGSIRYSKITDHIYENTDEQKHFEKLKTAKLCLINKLEECCICNDLNIVLTKCGHNLCRYCFSKMYKLENCCEEHAKKVLCPLCKNELC